MNELIGVLPIVRSILTILYNIFLTSVFVQFKYSKKITATILIAISVLCSGICFAFYRTGIVLSHPLLAVMLQFIIIFLCIFLISTVNIFRSIFIIFLVINFSIMSSSVGIIFNKNILVEIFAKIVMYLSIIVVSIKYFRPYTTDTSFKSNFWIFYDIIEVIFFGIFFEISIKFGIVGSVHCEVNNLVLAHCILMIFVYAGMFSSLHMFNISNMRKLELERIQTKESLIQNELLQQENFINQSKKLRHDIRHHGMVILDYIKEGETKKAEEYIEKYIDISLETSFDIFCNNYCLNSILRLFDSKFKSKNIEHTFLIKIKKDIIISDIDMCSLLSNMLENAYEAVMQSDVKKITLKIEQKNSHLFILLINSIKNAPDFSEGVPKTTKEIGGLGTKIISDIVKKYGGIVDFNVKNNQFITRCLFNDFSCKTD